MNKKKLIISLLLILSFAGFSAILFTNDVHSVQAANNIYINNRNFALELGHYRTLRVHGSSSRVTWTTSNSRVATVTSGGKVTAKAPGNVTITANVGGRKIACKVTVFKLGNESITLLPGKTGSFKITGASDITWSTGNKAIATVSTDGTVTAKAPGTAVITASFSGKEIPFKVYVAGDINYKSIVLEKGGKYGFIKTLKVSGSYNQITWSSSDESVATIGSDGRVRAAGPGTATITANADGILFTTKVKILEITTKEFTLKMGETKTLEVFGTNSNITWYSNKKTVATVNKNGTVTPVEEGTATIVAVVDGREVKAKVKVIK